MRNLSVVTLWLLVAAMARPAAAQTVYFWATSTNATANGNTLTVNGVTRTATNDPSAVLATHWRATNTAALNATNLYRHLQNYPFASIATVRMTNATTIELKGDIGTVISFSIGGSWGYGVMATSATVNAKAVMIPYYDTPQPTWTNWADGLLDLINDNARTNTFSEGAQAVSNLVGRTIAQTIGNKTVTNSVITNSTLHGTIGRLSGGDVASTTISNSSLKGSTITATSRVAQAAMEEGDWVAVRGAIGTNYIVVDETGLWLLLTAVSGGVAKTNLTPSLAELINYGTMLSLFPLRPHATTNWWGAHHRFTNAAANIIFFFGFDASNAVLRTPNIYQGTNWHGIYFDGTNFMDGSPLNGSAVMAGPNIRIGGPSGNSGGHFALGRNITLWSDDFPPVGGIGNGVSLTNDAKFVMGLNGERGTNALSYNVFGVASEDSEFRIGDATQQSFVRFGPPLKNVNTVAETTNVWRGDLSFPPKSITSMANGTNTITSSTNVVLNLDGTLTADSWISAIQGGREGKWHELRNNTGYNVALLHDSGFAPSVADRFKHLGNRDVVIAAGGSAWVSYSASRWVIANVYPEGAGLTLSASVTADNTTLSTTNVTYYRVTSNSGVAADRTCVLTPGTFVGQELTIEAVGVNAFEITDDSVNIGGGNNRLSATWTAGQYDALRLKFNGTDWVELGRSAN